MSEATEFIKEYVDARGGVEELSEDEKQALVLQYITEDKFPPQKIAAVKRALIRELGIKDEKKLKALAGFIDMLNSGSAGRGVMDGRRGYSSGRAW